MQKTLSLTIVLAILAWTVSLNIAHATCRGYPDYGCDSVNEWGQTYFPQQYNQNYGGQFNQNNSYGAQQLNAVQQRVMRRGF